MGTSNAPVAGPDFGLSDVMRGVGMVSGPFGMATGLLGIDTFGLAMDALGFGDARGGGIAGSADGTGHGAGEVGSDGLP